MESQLKDRHCKPCEKGSPALDSATTRLLLAEVPGWSLRAESGQPPKLTKAYEFADFSAAMAFVDKVAAIAEEEQHHPDFCVHYSRVDVTVWTHTVSGLSDNDFIIAAKLDAALP